MHPDAIFTEAILRPETQDLAVPPNRSRMAATHERAGAGLRHDGTIASACPPVRALLEIMASGASQEGWTPQSPEFRALFTRDSALASPVVCSRAQTPLRLRKSRAGCGDRAVVGFLAAADGPIGRR